MEHFLIGKELIRVYDSGNMMERLRVISPVPMMSNVNVTTENSAVFRVEKETLSTWIAEELAYFACDCNDGVVTIA
jgi:hypothetical protein